MTKWKVPIWHNQYQRITTENTQRKQQQHLIAANFRGEKSAVSSEVRLLLLSAHQYGLQEATVQRFLREFGAELVLKEFGLLKKLLEQKKPIQNPAGWLRRALVEQYADTEADLMKAKKEKQADIDAKNQARKEFYERRLREEQEKDRTELDESNPLYGYFLRHCKKDGNTETAGANHGDPMGT